MSPLHARSDWPWVFRELRPHTAGLALLSGLSAAEVALRMLLPWPVKAVLDHVAGAVPLSDTAAFWIRPLMAPLLWLDVPRPRALLGAVVVAGLAVHLLHRAVQTAHTRLQARLGLRLVRRLREQLFSHLQALDLMHHDRRPTGDAVYHLEADSGAIEQLLFRGLFPLTFSALTLVAMLVVLVSLDVRLAAASLGIVPFIYIWMRWRSRHMAPRVLAAKQAEAEMVSQVYESFSAIRLVKSYTREPEELGRFSRAAGAAMEARLRLTAQDAIFAGGIGVLTALGTALVLGLGGSFLLEAAITPGTLLIALTYLGFVYGPLAGIANTTASIQQALVSARRVRDTLRLPREDRDRHDAIAAPPFSGRVEYDEVSFEFEDGMRVVDRVSFTAAPGQMIALVGPSGSGKTTVASMIRFRDPTSGAVRIDGRDVREYRLESLRRQIALVLQEAVVLTGSVKENLRYGRLDATDAEIQEAARLANAHEFIEQLPYGYDTELAEAGRNLSGGQRQRLSIARAFLKRAPIVIFDEPTSALDAISEGAIVSALHRLRERRTIFVIAHRLSTVRGADVILVLDRGRIVGRGTHEALMRSSALYRDLAATMVA